MERATAIKKLGKLLGKSLAYRVDPNAPAQDQREEAQSQLHAAVAERNKLRDARDARQKALLESDQEYQMLLTRWRAAAKHVDTLASITRHYKFTVGTTNGMFFTIRSQGDSWEEIIAKLEGQNQ